MGVTPNPKMAFIFPISWILALIFPILIKYFPKCVGKGSFPKSQIKSLYSFQLVVADLHTTQAIVGYKFIHSVVPNLVYLIVNQSRKFLSLFSYTQYLHNYDIRLTLGLQWRNVDANAREQLNNICIF